ncbi:adenylate cyclase [Panacagrimonas perspica]|uniref:Adenylate cyclase n=1 Tax=Panacagrimonas perspica TaxID=381431 RepID=A0A4S3K469_9GAMM|nr:CYTH domain-containing protein [Panacagrimonas perspica]TDU25879.1 adenylate cyclase [Panacagrimonas perspica]THD02758.1 CYTH domain protein [Panacagrimonas perspica]
MPVEIERKFLVVDDTWRWEVSRHRAMQQGYLGAPGGKASIRVRLEGKRALLNVKAAVMGAVRAEYEYEIPLEEGREMFDNLCIGRLEKTRHYIDRDGLTWEVDEFHGDNDGLVVAEVELIDPQQEIPRPAWLGREVTEEPKYYNHSLSLKPFRSWHAH